MKNKEPSILLPVLNDRVLMELMRFKYIPLSFVLQKCGLAFNKKNAIDVIDELCSLGNGKTNDGDGFSTSFVRINPQFQVIKQAIHVSIGIEGGVKANTILYGAEVVKMLRNKMVSINTSARDLSSEFNTKTYKPTVKLYAQYERVLRDCEKRTSIAPVLEKHGMTMEEWQRLKSAVARFGLNSDIRFASEVLIDGSLIHELQRRHIGKPLPDVVSMLLREALEANK